MKTLFNFREYCRNIKTTKTHEGYFCSVERTLIIMILGSMCGLQSMKNIQLWASNEKTREFLFEHFGILSVPSYSWFLGLASIIKPDSLNECFIEWVKGILPKTLEGLVISMDGKTIRSTGKMKNSDKTLHIVSAHVANLGITIGQKTVSEKSNEIPAVRDLIKLLDINGCIVVADALNCQKKTCKEIIDAGADYLLVAKDNQEKLKDAIETTLFGEESDIKINDDIEESTVKNVDIAETYETNRGRIEKRIAFTSSDINDTPIFNKWIGLKSVGAINRQTIRDGKMSNEWHFYISSKYLTAEELLIYARNEWSVETLHWLLDVHYREDYCRVENSNVQNNLNIIRKIALNIIADFKQSEGSKLPISNIMLKSLIDTDSLKCILGTIQ
jgi:predicted transposase YbfD/YdcC